MPMVKIDTNVFSKISQQMLRIVVTGCVILRDFDWLLKIKKNFYVAKNIQKISWIIKIPNTFRVFQYNVERIWQEISNMNWVY